MRHARGLFATLLIATITLAWAPPGAAAPEGQMTWAVHVSLAPTWFDPAETPGIITPFMVQPVLHFLNGVGALPAVHGLGLIKNHAFSAPYEDLKLKGK